MLAVNANRYWPVEIGGAWHCPMNADCAPFLRCHKLRTDIDVDIVVVLSKARARWGKEVFENLLAARFTGVPWVG
jgi:hypothetical protein